MNRKWNEKNTLEKTVTVISVISLCIWFLVEYFGKRLSLQYADTISYIALFIICTCEAISFWNVKRYISYIAIGGLLCMIAVVVLEMMVIS